MDLSDFIIDLCVVALACSLAACTDDGGGDDTSGTTLSATVVPCPAQADAVVTAPGFAFSPATTPIAVGQVVEFQMPVEHDALSNDQLFNADFGVSTCVRFDAPGTYRFHCDPHGFTGSVVVQ